MQHKMRQDSGFKWVAPSLNFHQLLGRDRLAEVLRLMIHHTRYPEQLSVDIGGYMGRSYSLETSGGDLKYRAYSMGYKLRKTLTLHPSHDDWQVFLQALDDLDVWNWHSEYLASGVVDGTQWGVEILWGERKIISQGSNSYPGSNGFYLLI